MLLSPLRKMGAKCNNSRLLACAWLFSLLFACLACLPIYSVAWMAVPNHEGTNVAFGGQPLSEIMNIGPMAPTIPTASQPVAQPMPCTVSVASQQTQLPSLTDYFSKTSSNKKNCCCDYSDVADESFFSVLNGIIIAIRFLVSLPWYLLSRGLEYSLRAAHWMVGSTISHPLASIWGYGFLLFITVWVVDSMGGVGLIASELCGWLASRSQYTEQIHTNVVARTSTRVVEVPQQQEIRANGREMVERARQRATEIRTTNGHSKISEQNKERQGNGFHEMKSTLKHHLDAKNAENQHKERIEKKTSEGNEEIAKGHKKIRVRVVPAETPPDEGTAENSQQQEEGIENETPIEPERQLSEEELEE